MESLGGDREWKDRFIAYHGVIIYYWALVVLYILRPELSYNFSHLIENHAVDTYEQFLEENEEILKKLPPPAIASNYYKTGDLYLFDAFQGKDHNKGLMFQCEKSGIVEEGEIQNHDAAEDARYTYELFIRLRANSGEEVAENIVDMIGKKLSRD